MQLKAIILVALSSKIFDLYLLVNFYLFIEDWNKYFYNFY